MTYVAPTITTFKERYPHFDPVNAGLLEAVLLECINEVGATWLERDRAKAQMLLCAHKLTMEGEPARANGTNLITDETLDVNSVSIGDVSVSVSNKSAKHTGATSSQQWYLSTNYGAQYLDLMRLNFPAVAVV